MNPETLLGLIADLYAQVSQLSVINQQQAMRIEELTRQDSDDQRQEAS
jgi:hypothetical protein